MEERILTLHPEGKNGVNISKSKYDTVSAAMLDVLRVRGEATFWEAAADVEQRLADKFDGSIAWYFTTVKLDLEARGVIERVPGSSPQRIRLSA